MHAGELRTCSAARSSSASQGSSGSVRGHTIQDEPWRPLTIREFEVARLIGAGRTNGEIAAELAIAPKTVSAHVEHVLAKLDMRRRAEVATWVATVRRPGRVPASAGASANR